MKGDELREKIELALRYELKGLFNDLKSFGHYEKCNKFAQVITKSTEIDIMNLIRNIKKFNNCTGDFSCFYGYMYELDENDEQKLICLDEEQCKDLPDISGI